MAEKIVLAYSGGLDTCVAIRWLKEERGYDVIALHIDMGTEKDFDVLQERALAAGAAKALWRDGKEIFIRYFAFPPWPPAPSTRATTRWRPLWAVPSSPS